MTRSLFMLVLIKENACNLWPKISLKFRKSFEIFKFGYGIVSEILRNIYPCWKAEDIVVKPKPNLNLA